MDDGISISGSGVKYSPVLQAKFTPRADRGYGPDFPEPIDRGAEYFAALAATFAGMGIFYPVAFHGPVSGEGLYSAFPEPTAP